MSGMSKLKKYKWYILPLTALLLLNVAVITKEFSSYKEETLRLGSILSGKPQNEVTLDEAEEALKQYGYINGNISSTSIRFIKFGSIYVGCIFRSVHCDCNKPKTAGKRNREKI